MTGTFTLRVRLGNAAMQNAGDVARALRDVADRIEVYGFDERHIIFDLNGNSVGDFGRGRFKSE